MRIQTFSLRRSGSALLAACIACSVAGLIVAFESRVAAEDDAGARGSSETKSKDAGGRSAEAFRKKKRHGTAKAAVKPAVVTPDGASKVAATASPAPTPEAKAQPAIDFSAQLDQAGATACHGQVNALATSTMGDVERFNTVSNWSQVAGDKRAVTVAIGQKYATGSAVPFGLSQVISAPNRQGSCDGFIVQVVPSPLSCSKLRDSIVAQRGQQIGDLAGIPLMQDAAGRTMLVPTAANTCVVVATRAFYPK